MLVPLDFAPALDQVEQNFQSFCFGPFRDVECQQVSRRVDGAWASTYDSVGLIVDVDPGDTVLIFPIVAKLMLDEVGG